MLLEISTQKTKVHNESAEKETASERFAYSAFNLRLANRYAVGNCNVDRAHGTYDSLIKHRIQRRQNPHNNNRTYNESR